MFTGKVIVITGASSGIGYSTAIEAQKRNATVVWASRNIEDNRAIHSLLVNGGTFKNVDVRSETSVESLFKYVKHIYGHVDALINCAGYVEPESMLATSMDNWNKTIQTNLTGTFLCCKYAVELMKETGGKIVNVSSTAGITARPGWSAYAASKSGVINFSTAIAEELAEYNIKIFIICPGRTATPLRKILAPFEDPQSIMQSMVVANTILYCLQEESDPLEGFPILVRERF